MKYFIYHIVIILHAAPEIRKAAGQESAAAFLLRYM